MTRSVPEWRGSSDDSPAPPRVRLRVFDRDGGKCQGPCGRKLYPQDKWDTDHKRAIINGGENRESNLQTLCAWCHEQKTEGDVAEKAKVAGTRKKHLGIRKPSSMPGSRNSKYKRKLSGEVVLR